MTTPLDPRKIRLLPTLALLVLAGSSARAQAPRLTLGPIVSYTDVSPIYDHTTVWGTTDFGLATETERLTVDRATTVGARLVLRVAGPWVISAEGSRGGTQHTYHFRHAVGDAAFEERQQWGRGTVTTLALRVGRQVDLPVGATSAEVSLGAGLQRVAVRGYPPCQAPAPSLGFASFPCGNEAWHGTYDVPSVSGGLQLSRRLVGRLRVHAGGVYTVGRANTSAFWRDLIPELDHLESPRSHTVRVTQLSVGLGVGL